MQTLRYWGFTLLVITLSRIQWEILLLDACGAQVLKQAPGPFKKKIREEGYQEMP